MMFFCIQCHPEDGWKILNKRWKLFVFLADVLHCKQKFGRTPVQAPSLPEETVSKKTSASCLSQRENSPGTKRRKKTFLHFLISVLIQFRAKNGGLKK